MATTGNTSAQNNVVTAAEYQAAADEITAILAAQREQRAPIEAEQALLRNRQELLIARQQSALNTLQAAEADPSNTAFLESSRTAYARATGEVNATSLAIQQNRSVLGQSLQASAELQDQRTNLEVKADFAQRSPPTLNSLTPPATTTAGQSATYVAPPAPPIPPEITPPLLTDQELLQIYPETDPKEVGAIKGTTIISEEARRIMSDPAVIRQQLAINATSVSPVPPTTSSRPLSDQETSQLFQEIDNPPAAANNRTTGAEYQAAADEITAIINAQRAERAPIEAQQELLQNRQELLIARQQSALNTLQAAEADPSNTAFLEASRTAYARATGEVNATNLAIQQNRSILAQSRQATAELQDQRNNLEVKADFADRSPPGLNSLTPPATVLPDQEATYVAPPAAPVLPVVAAESQIESPAEPIAVSAQNNQLTRAEYQAAADEVFEIQSAARDTSAQLANQVSQNQAAYTAADNQATQLRREYRAAEAAGASPAELASLAADYEAQIETTAQLGEQLSRSESALAANQQYRLELAAQENYLSQQASRASGPPGFNSIPGPGTEVPDQSVSAVNEIQPPIARSFTPPAPAETLAQPTFETAGSNNVIAAEEYQAAADEVSAIQQATRSESARLSEQLALDEAALSASSRRANELQLGLRDAQASGANEADIASLSAAYEAEVLQNSALDFQVKRTTSALAANQQYSDELVAQENNLTLQAAVAESGPANLNSEPGLATTVPDQDIFAFESNINGLDLPSTYNAPNLNDPYYGLSPEQIQALGTADPTDPYIRARLGIPQLPGSTLQATPGFGTIRTGVPLIDNALSFLGGLFGGPPKPAAAPVAASGDEALQAVQDAEAALLAEQEGRAFPPVEAPLDPAASGDEALQAIEDAEAAALGTQEGSAFAEPAPVPASGDEALQAVQDAEDRLLAEQEGRAFPPVEDPAAVPAAGDEALQAIEDAELAAAREAEGRAFAEPAPVAASGDEALQAIEDAEAEALAQQEGLAFPPIDSPAPVSGDDALQAIEDAEAAALAREEGIAFLEPLPVDAAGDEALQAAEDAELAAQEGLAFPPITNPAPVSGDDALQAIEDAEAAELARAEGVAFAEPLDVPASGDEALQAIEDAELAAQEGGAFAQAPEPVGDEALAATEEAELAAIREAEANAVFGPAPVVDSTGYGAGTDEEAAAINQALADDAEINGAAGAQAGREAQLREQFTIQQRYNTSTQGDWRVRIRLAPGANYLYKAPAGQRGILEPLVASDGVIFPYTPTIQTSYQAKYDSYNLTHSNYRGYFYQGSQVGDISVSGIFTAQDTDEANYMLAVIHFFRSVTKMFYGKDQFRGAPPPLVELSGFGQYQFNNHPCLVASFNYSLPKDVDYIQIAPNNQGLNLGARQPKVSSSPSSTLESVGRRLSNAGLPKGGQTSPTDLGVVTNSVNGTSQTTYVPTKIEIAITLHPLQTRQQVSQGFSLENFANGNLLKGGFW